MKLFYVANNQLPTIKAHGTQIMKTCEALSALGLDVELIVPKRGLYPEITESDPIQYYGIKHPFKITQLLSKSFVHIHAGSLGSRILFWVQQYLFARTVRAYLPKGSIAYSRDQFMMRTLSGRGYTLFWEAHTFPRSINSRFYKKILFGLKGLVVISHGLSDAFAGIGFPAKEILIAPDGFDPSEFQVPETKEEARLKLGLPKDSTIVAYTGQLFEWKGTDVLVQTAQELPKEFHVVVVGGTREDIEVLKKIDTKRVVRFEGFKRHNLIPLYLRAADIVVLPNKKDNGISELYTSPLKLFEYMAAGKPIIASDIRSVREILNDSNAVLIEPNSSAALARAIQDLLNDIGRRDRISKKALADAAQFSWQQRALKIRDFIARRSVST